MPRARAIRWKDTATLLEVYQQPDPASVLTAMSEGRKLLATGLDMAPAADAPRVWTTKENEAAANGEGAVRGRNGTRNSTSAV
jgi:hypothetical protein